MTLKVSNGYKTLAQHHNENPVNSFSVHHFKSVTPVLSDCLCVILSTGKRANSADPDQTADQGLHCFQSPLHLLDALLQGKASFFNFKGDYSKFSGVRNFRIFTEDVCSSPSSFSITSLRWPSTCLSKCRGFTYVPAHEIMALFVLRKLTL